MAVPISVTVTIPITMPSVVSSGAHLVRADRLQRNGQPLPQFDEQLHGSAGPALVAGDQAVADAHDAPRVPGHILLVRDHDDGVACLGQVPRRAP